MTGSSGSHVHRTYSKEHVFLNGLGFPHKEVEKALKSNGNDEHAALGELMHMLASGLGLKIDATTGDVDPEELQETLEMEIEALGSM